MDPATTSLVVLAATIAMFIWNRLPVEVVAIGAGLVLLASGLLTVPETLAGFGDPVVVFIVALFVVSEGLSASGVTAWIGQQLVDRAGSGRRRVLTVAMLLTALLSALISLNGAIAALLPVMIVLSARTGIVPSRLLMPVAFAASAGALLVLTGTPINVIVSDAAVAAGLPPFGFFEFGIVGVPLVLGTVVIAVLLGDRLLPQRPSTVPSTDFSGYARELVSRYALAEDTFRLRVRSASELVDAPLADLTLPGDLRVLSVRDSRGLLRPTDGALRADDQLIVRGDAEAVCQLMLDGHLALGSESADHLADSLVGYELGVAEVIVPPRSRLVGERVHPGLVRRGDQVVLAVSRMGQDRPGETVLMAGDSLLIQGTWDSLELADAHPDVIVVDAPDVVRRQAAPLGPRAWRAVVVVAGMVALLSFGVVPAVVAALLAALAMVVLGVVSVDQAYRAIPWTTVVLVGALIPMSTAIQKSGAAEVISDVLVGGVAGAGPYALMAVLFVTAAVLGQFVSNTATALILIPVAVTAAEQVGISAQPVLMLMAVASAASFLTPIATPANMLVLGPGGYRFGDYWRLGLPVTIWFGIVGVLLVPLVWSF